MRSAVLQLSGGFGGALPLTEAAATAMGPAQLHLGTESERFYSLNETRVGFQGGTSQVPNYGERKMEQNGQEFKNP